MSCRHLGMFAVQAGMEVLTFDKCLNDTMDICTREGKLQCGWACKAAFHVAVQDSASRCSCACVLRLAACLSHPATWSQMECSGLRELGDGPDLPNVVWLVLIFA